ncbi:MAG: hypothetical protein J1E82_03655 [Muribaculaceae bacterium]|nr:hypothetical protein [Muribaculaceae bacterium]
MTTYSSDEITFNAPAEKVYDKLSNLENLKSLLEKVPADKVPEDKRQMFENIVITPETIEVPGGPMGKLVFRLTEKVAPSLIKLSGEGIPIALALEMHIKPLSETTSAGKVDINIDIPAMLKPMVGGQIQKMAGQFGNILSAISF